MKKAVIALAFIVAGLSTQAFAHGSLRIGVGVDQGRYHHGDYGRGGWDRGGWDHGGWNRGDHGRGGWDRGGGRW